MLPTLALAAGLLALSWACAPRLAHARGAQESARANADDLDGVYLMLGPLAAVSYMDLGWQGTFGGQMLALRVRERARLAVLGLSLGGLRHTDSAGGRVWTELFAGTRIAGVHTGLSLGPVAWLDGIEPPDLGAQATIWVFAGVIPYARVGAADGRGAFVEVGVQLMLPALRL